MAVLLMKQTIIKGCVVYKYTLKYRACIGQAACDPSSDEHSLGLAGCV